MCHEYHLRTGTRDRSDERDETDEDVPSFLNEDADPDVELVTDGGDE